MRVRFLLLSGAGSGLSVASAVSASSTPNLSFTPATTLAPANAVSLSTLSAPVLAPKTALSVAGTVSASFAGNDQPGLEYITNGSFTGGGTGWTNSLGVSYSSNVANINAGTPRDALMQDIAPLPGTGKWLKVTFTISGYVVGEVGPKLVGTATMPAITITKTTAANTNPLEWDSDFVDWVSWDSATSSGDQHRLIYTTNGVETIEAWQGLDDELLTGGFIWPTWESIKPLAAGTVVTVKEQRRRLVNGVQTMISNFSNVITVTLDAFSWTPADITGDRTWFDISDISTLFQDTAGAVPVTAVGQSVARVNDKSGNGRHYLQATAANRPIYRTNGGAGGNKPYLEFDGANDIMQTAAFAAEPQPNFRSLAIKLNTLAVTQTLCDGIAVNNRSAIFMLNPNSTFGLNAGAGQLDLRPADTNRCRVAALFNGAASICYKNNSPSAACNPSNQSLTGLSIGGAYTLGSCTAMQWYGEVVVFGADPSASMAYIDAWLAALQA